MTTVNYSFRLVAMTNSISHYQISDRNTFLRATA